MIQAPRSPGSPQEVKRFALMLVATWSVFIVLIFVWHFSQIRETTLATARIQAVDTFEKDLVYRRWAAGHGGVYVPSTQEVLPNYYLSHLADRDVTTSSGLELTLVNPA